VALLDDLLPQGSSGRGWLEVAASVPLHAMYLGFTAGNGQIAALPALPVSSLDPLQHLVESHNQAFPHAGVVAGLSSSSKSRQVAAAGLAEIEKAVDMSALHAGEIGSVSKTFVAALALRQIESGLLDLDSPLSHWFPEFPRATQITLRMLLNHTSGIPDYTQTAGFQADFGLSLEAGDFRTWSCEEILAYVQDLPPLFPPGSAFSYGNTGYVLAAAILERSAGSSLAALLRARILDPLDLRHTWLQDVEPARQPAWTGYILDVSNGTAFAATHRYHRSAVLGAAGIASTPQDLLRFFQALFSGELLSADSLAQMTTPLPVTLLSPEYAYGLGLMLTLSEGRVIEAGHNGNWIDGTSAVIHSMALDQTIVVQCNHNQGTQTQALAAKLRQLFEPSQAQAIPQGSGSTFLQPLELAPSMLTLPKLEHPMLENHPLFKLSSSPTRAQLFVW
jgi:D-alanyl-D-alanine carboxypeptidase